AQFLTWKDPDRLLEEIELVVARRPGAPDEHADPGVVNRVCFLDMPLLDVSSTDIRTRARAGRSIRYLVPEPVRAYITEKSLYS
ncbi:nicotinic acid mononucleotide adenylyltransferase, partial [bacterium]|nr:nicotinic acid mononucleotide adenylyltransferase [bacterium]